MSDKQKNDMQLEKAHFRKLFDAGRETMTAMGDSNRQLIIRLLIERCGEGGLRVGVIQKNTNISRATVSHHLKVLKETGVVKVRREGTKNYYYLDSQSTGMKNVMEFWKAAEKMMSFCPYHTES